MRARRRPAWRGWRLVRAHESLDADIVTRNDSSRFRFPFPTPISSRAHRRRRRSLSGPATIAVSHVADDHLWLDRDTCRATAAGLGLVVRRSALRPRRHLRPHSRQTFTTALPPPPTTQATCYNEAALHRDRRRPSSRSMPRQPARMHWQDPGERRPSAVRGSCARRSGRRCRSRFRMDSSSPPWRPRASGCRRSSSRRSIGNRQASSTFSARWTLRIPCCGSPSSRRLFRRHCRQ